MVWGRICVFFCSSSRPKSPLLCHLLKYMGGSPRATKSFVAKEMCVFTNHLGILMVSPDNAIFFRPSSLTQISSRRKICEKDVHSHTNYGSFLAPNRFGKWAVFFSLKNATDPNFSSSRMGCAKINFLARNVRFEPFLWISEGPSGSFARFDAFSGPYPLLEGDPMR